MELKVWIVIIACQKQNGLLPSQLSGQMKTLKNAISDGYSTLLIKLRWMDGIGLVYGANQTQKYPLDHNFGFIPVQKVDRDFKFRLRIWLN